MEIILFNNAKHLLFLILFPIVGFSLQANTSKENIYKVLKANIILLLPIVFGYDYFLKWLVEFFLMLVMASGFAFLLMKMKKEMHRYLVSILLTIVLTVILGGMALFFAFAGNKTTLDKWRNNSYKVEYVREQGFAGSPLITYELYYSPLFGFLNKKIQTIPIRSNNAKKNCILSFDKVEIDFNTCTNIIILK